MSNLPLHAGELLVDDFRITPPNIELDVGLCYSKTFNVPHIMSRE